MRSTDLLAIGDIAVRSGFAASALRFYEQRGLIEATRTPAGQRRYPRSTLRRLAFIRAATNVGLSLEEVRVELARLPQGRTPTKRDWARISERWRARLDEQIEGLQALRGQLDSCIGCGCLSMRQCTFSNPEDLAGRTGAAGAQFWPPALRREG